MIGSLNIVDAKIWSKHVLRTLKICIHTARTAAIVELNGKFLIDSLPARTFSIRGQQYGQQ